MTRISKIIRNAEPPWMLVLKGTPISFFLIR